MEVAKVRMYGSKTMFVPKDGGVGNALAVGMLFVLSVGAPRPSAR